MAKITEIIKVDDVSNYIKSGTKLMVGGFLGAGEPIRVLDYISEQQDIKDLFLISVVSARVGGHFGIGKLAANKQIKKYLGAHLGTDPVMSKQYVNGEVEVEFNPMGTFIERIRAGGSGLGAVVTPVGIGTEVEEVASEKRDFFGKPQLVFSPVRADKLGNLEYEGTTVNTNPTMAMAADIVIAEVDEIVEVGEIHPDRVGTPGIFVDYIVQGYSKEERKEMFGKYWEEMNFFSK